MTKQETLDHAIASLRSVRGDASQCEPTLERITQSIEQERPRWNWQAAAALLLAVSLGGTAYASVWGLPLALRNLLSPGAEQGVSSAKSHVAVGSANVAPAVLLPASSYAPSAQAEVDEVAPENASEPRKPAAELPIRSHIQRPHTALAREDSKPDSIESTEQSRTPQELYDEAHRLHFVARDVPMALRAWERFLRHAGNSPMAVEARYNRALCLVKLREFSDARLALDSIARGEQGAYRQREARALLKALQ